MFTGDPVEGAPRADTRGTEPGFAFYREDTEKLIGSEIDPEVWRFTPWDDKIVVKRLPTVTKVGSLYVPENAKEAIAAGHVIRCGLNVGKPSNRKPIPMCPYDGWELIGKVVIFGHYAGKAIQGGAQHRKDPYDSDYLVLTEPDIWGVVEPIESDDSDTSGGVEK
jgi:co-chaperonin GroES (HSP10)